MRNIKCFFIEAWVIASIFISCPEGNSQSIGKDNTRHDVALSDQHLASGLVKYKAKDYKGALIDFEMAIKNNPSNGKAYRSKGDAQQGLDEYAEAVESYSKALTINSSDTLSYKGRAESKRMSGSYETSLADYEIALQWDPKDADMYFGRGSSYYKLGEYVKSIKDYSTILEKYPKDLMSYLKRSLPYIENSQYAEAKQDLKTYLQLGGKEEGAYFYLGWSYIYLADYDRSKSDSAIYYLDRYTQSKNKANRNDPSGYMLLGMAYRQKGDSTKTRQSFQKSISLKPESNETYFQWANAEINFSNFKKADELLAESLRRGKKTSPDFYYLYGLSKAGIRDTTMAIEYYTKALALDSNKREVYENRAALLFGSNRHNKILLSDLDDLIRLAKEDQEKAEWYSAKSFANLMAKDTASARMEVETAIKLIPMEPMHYMIRAQVNSAESKSVDIVLKDVDKAIRIDPTLTEAYLFKATYYALHGDHKNGCKTLKYALKIGGSVPKEVENYVCKGTLTKSGKVPDLFIPFSPRLTINKVPEFNIEN